MKIDEEKEQYMISVVAEKLNVHPQTLRFYEKRGLIKPSRSKGNTRLYSWDNIEKLKLILRLTNELGVNLAGVEVILNMRDAMKILEKEKEDLEHQLTLKKDNI
jgi:MerR family transcriptional regulator, heat shock protein HspR